MVKGKKYTEPHPLPGYNFRAPCLGFYLQGGVKALAVMDVGVQLAMITVLSIGLSAFKADWWEIRSMGEHAKFYFRFAHWGYSYCYNIICILLSKRLFDSASQRDKSALTKWLVTSIILYIPLLGLFLAHTFWAKWAHASGGAVFGVHVTYKIYLFWVVYCFTKEIKYYSGINFALRTLHDADIEEFIYGNPAIPGNEEYEKFSDKPYKREFEIPLHRLEMDEGNPLGKGAFGVVLKGKLRNEVGDPFSETEARTVAVKTVYNDIDDCYFNALLSELKILTYIGRHENIVNLVGACTSELKQRKLYVLVEFCALGSMLNYIRSHKGLFVNREQMQETNSEVVTEQRASYVALDIVSFSSTDLIQWAMETAAGMEYLSSKKVVHGDLAARNVLLTMDRIVKIADFGLSRQLYHYSTYVSRREKPLPWRWSAIEVLTDRKFSPRSDVWSFGTTIWEYFTHGATPYSSWSYSEDFVDLLKSGNLRLEKPSNAPQIIYDKLLQCWNPDPASRPTFSDLRFFFSQVLQRYSSQPQLDEPSSMELQLIDFNTDTAISSTDTGVGVTYVSAGVDYTENFG